MLDKIRFWVENTNLHFASARRPCTEFKELFAGFFPEDFLVRSYYVETTQLPSLPRDVAATDGLGDLFDRGLEGLTLDDTYYLTTSAVNNLRLHFHELVHVAQWQQLGVTRFIERYIDEISLYGYDQMPLELMAYNLDTRFVTGGSVVNIPSVVHGLLVTQGSDSSSHRSSR